MSSELFLQQFESVFSKYKAEKKIAIYGTGFLTIEVIQKFVDWPFVALCDRNHELIGSELLGLPIVDINELPQLCDLVIIVCNSNYYSIIANRISFLSEEFEIPIYYADGTLYEPQQKRKGYRCPSYADYCRLIDQHQVIGFDIFDTLIMRKIGDSKDILALLNAGSGDDFAKRRQKAEIACYAKGMCPTISEIYEEMKATDDPESELSLEKRMIMPRSTLVRLYEYAIQCGKQVILVSDMYYSEQMLLSLLQKCGIVHVPKLYVSCEVKKKKSDGSMWEWIKEQFPDKSLLFIGDDQESDVSIPQRYGIDAIHVDSAQKSFSHSSLSGILDHVSNEAESIIAGLIAAKVCSDPFPVNDSHGQIVIDHYENIGYVLFGPVFVSYLLWVMKMAQNENVNTLLFVARDGYFLKRAFQKMASRMGVDTPPSVYFEISRSLAMMCAAQTDSDIQHILNQPYQGTVKDWLMMRFALETEDQQKLNTVIDDIDDIVKPYRGQLIRNCAIQRKRLKDYMKQKNVQGICAIVEPSYMGTIQYHLSKCCDMPLLGFYMNANMESDYHQGKRMYACFQETKDRNGTQSPLYGTRCMLEDMILVAPTGGVLYYDEQGAPVFEDAHYTQLHFEDKERIYQGIEKYIDDYLSIYQDYDAAKIPDTRMYAASIFSEAFHNIKIADALKETFYADHNFSTKWDRKIFE